MIPLWKHSRQDRKDPAGMEIKPDLGNLKVVCPKCKTVHTGNDVWNHSYICPNCGKYMPIGAKERLAMVLDEASFEPWFEDVGICDPLGTPRLSRKTGRRPDQKRQF